MSTTTSEFLRHLRTLAARQANDLLSDQQLLQRFLEEGSEASFAALVQRHGPMVLSVCRRVLHHAQDAEDAFQATFLILVRKAGSIRKRESLGSWLHGVAYHRAECLRAKSMRRNRCERRLLPRPDGDAEADITLQELRSVQDEELQRLPEKHRAPLVLCYLEARAQDEAARQLGWSKNTFGRRMNQARQLLAHRLTRRGLTLPAALTAPVLVEGMATAAVSPLLAASTVCAGLALAMGNTITGIVAAQVVAMIEGGVASLLAKKASVAVVLLVSLALSLGVSLAHRAVHNRTLAEAPAAPLAPAAPTQPARSESKDNRIEIKGRVFDPEGKPVARAKVYLSTYTEKDKSDPKVRAETDVDGSFRFMAKPTEVDRDKMVAAVAPGYGPDWTSLKKADRSEVTLRLVKDDAPINGRVLDLEGRPIPGVTVVLFRVMKMPGEDLSPWLKDLHAKPNDRFAVSQREWRYYDQIMSSVWGVPGTPPSVKTGTDGRFQFRGLGRDRVANLGITGPGIEYRWMTVVTRPRLEKGLPPHIHGAAFDHLAAPNKPSRGTVRDKKTGKPLAGIQVACRPASEFQGQAAATDKKGRFDIPGIRKDAQYMLHVEDESGPYIAFAKNVAETPGLEPVVVDMEMERGLALRVRVKEKGSGQTVPALFVQYHAHVDNPHLKDYRTFPRQSIRGHFSEKDGSYHLAVLPGRGFLTVRAAEDLFTRARLEGQEDPKRSFGSPTVVASVSPLLLDMMHTVVPINASADEPKSLVWDIALDPGRTISGTVVDTDGRPLAGAMTAGLHSLVTSPPPRPGRDNADSELHSLRFGAVSSTGRGFLPCREETGENRDPTR